MISFLKDNLRGTIVHDLAKHYRQWRRFNDVDRTLVFVHIGKCGGSSLFEAILASDRVRERFDNVRKVHVEQPPVLKNARYLFVVRNPIKRAISAFNWRYKLVVTDEVQKTRFPGEYEILVKYGSLNSLAEKLYSDGSLNSSVAADFRDIHHLKEDIAFYANEVSKRIRENQIFGILATETLGEDVSDILGVELTANKHENSSKMPAEKMHLSAEAHNNLRRFLAADYETLERLLQMNSSTHAPKGILLS